MENAKLNDNLIPSEGGANIEALHHGERRVPVEVTQDKDENISCFKLFYEWRQCTCKLSVGGIMIIIVTDMFSCI